MTIAPTALSRKELQLTSGYVKKKYFEFTFKSAGIFQLKT
jgi:hypothetical protein